MGGRYVWADSHQRLVFMQKSRIYNRNTIWITWSPPCAPPCYISLFRLIWSYIYLKFKELASYLIWVLITTTLPTTIKLNGLEILKSTFWKVYSNNILLSIRDVLQCVANRRSLTCKSHVGSCSYDVLYIPTALIMGGRMGGFVWFILCFIYKFSIFA